MSRLPLHIVVLAATLAGWAPLFPAVARAAALDDPRGGQLEQQKKIHRLKKGIEGQRALVKASQRKETSLLAELEDLDARLSRERTALADLRRQLDQQELKLTEKQHQLAAARARRQNAGSRLEQRLAAYYRLGPVGLLNSVFSSQSLPELLSFQEYFTRLLDHDRRVMDRYRRRVAELSRARAALLREKQKLVAIIATIKEHEHQLALTREQRLALLSRVRTEKQLYQQALREIEQAASRLTATLARLKEQSKAAAQPAESPATLHSPKKRRPAGWGRFAARKGRLPPPVPGEVVTVFGRKGRGRLGVATVARGIDIKTAPGAKVRAIFDGTVVYAGILRGYGKLIIIDHGHHYYSLVSRMTALAKNKGEPVRQGEVIGEMADHDGEGRSLHFEIRHGTKPEDPLLWVDNGSFRITASRR